MGAISLYRQAVNGAPLSVVPRLKLAQAYQHGGMTEKSLDEAKRALEIAPDSLAVQQFLTQLDQDNGTSDGALTRYRAVLDRDPTMPPRTAGWRRLCGTAATWKQRKWNIRPLRGWPHKATILPMHIWRSSMRRWRGMMTAWPLCGARAKMATLSRCILSKIAPILSAARWIHRARAFAAGKSTREQFYDGAKKVSAQAQALAGFVAKIIPPAECKLSHLHRMLATNLLAQEAATLVTFIETGDVKLGDSVSQLDKEAQTEMLTARAAEEKLGLWEIEQDRSEQLNALLENPCRRASVESARPCQIPAKWCDCTLPEISRSACIRLVFAPSACAAFSGKRGDGLPGSRGYSGDVTRPKDPV